MQIIALSFFDADHLVCLGDSTSKFQKICFEFELKGFANSASRFQIVENKSCEEHKPKEEKLSQSVSDLVSTDD